MTESDVLLKQNVHLMSPENPLVSIIVRTKDRPKLLKRALQSIASQTYSPVEVVLVNDGGCDLDIEELKTVLGDISLNYIRLEKNVGRAQAGNIGIENAKGKYIGFLDDDDEFHQDHVVTLVSFLEQSDYAVAYTDSFMVYKEYNPETREVNNDVKREVVFSKDFNYGKLVFENYIPLMCLLFGRKPLIASGGFDRSFEIYEDWDLLIRIGKTCPFYHIRQVTANYNQWSEDFQISQVYKDPDFLRRGYLQVMSRHIKEITPNSIYGIISECAHSRQILQNLRNESELNRNSIKERDLRIDNLATEVRERESRISVVSQELAAKDSRIAGLSTELKERDLRIDNLTAEVRERESRISVVSQELAAKDSRIAGLSTELKERDLRIDNLATEVRERESRISVVSQELAAKDSRIAGLSTELKERDLRIDNLEAEVREREARISAVSQELAAKDSRIDNLISELTGKDLRIDSFVAEGDMMASRLNDLSSVIAGKEAETLSLQNVIREREGLITAMWNTRGWRLLEKFRKVRDNFPVPLFRKTHKKVTDRTGK